MAVAAPHPGGNSRRQRDIMSILTEQGINRYTNQVNFVNETNEESDRGGFKDGELKTSGMPTKENASDEEVAC